MGQDTSLISTIQAQFSAIAGKKTYIVSLTALAYLAYCYFGKHPVDVEILAALGFGGLAALKHGQVTSVKSLAIGIIADTAKKIEDDDNNAPPAAGGSLLQPAQVVPKAQTPGTAITPGPTISSLTATVGMLLVGLCLAGMVSGCAWFRSIPNSPERTAKITSDALLQQVWFFETNYAASLALKEHNAKLAKDTNALVNLAGKRALFVLYVDDFRSEYTNALNLYLSVKPKDSTNAVSAQDLLRFSNGFQTAATNLFNFVNATKALAN